MAKKELNYDALDAMLQFKVNKKFCAEYLEMSEDTLERRLREDKDKTFTEYHQLKMGRTAIKLQQKSIDMAMRGNVTMMIFCLKNLAGWSDKQEVVQTTEIKINIDSEDEGL